MNATLASQNLDDFETTEHEESSPKSTHAPIDLPSTLLLPIVAFLTALLPLLYFGLAGLIAWGIWEYAIFVNEVFAPFPNGLRTSIALLPVIPGAIAIASFVFPWFTSSPRRETTLPISQKDQPFLVSFINRLAESVESTGPSVIELACSPVIYTKSTGVNSSEYRIVVGLPLLASLPLQSLAGRLAREIGPHSRPLPLTLERFARSIGSRFDRMATWKSSLELRIEGLLREHRKDPEAHPMMAAVCLQIIRLPMRFARFLLRGFSLVCRSFSAPCLRRRELTADAFHTSFSGSVNFTGSLRQTTKLEAAYHLARRKIESLSSDNRLARDFPGLIADLANSLPPDSESGIRDRLNRSTHWLKFRPSVNERIHAAYGRDDAGIFSSEKPASSLFRDLDRAGEILTRHWYENELQRDPRQFELVSSAAITRDSTSARRQIAAAEAFFAGSLDPNRPLFPSRETIGTKSQLPEIPTERIPAHFETEVKSNRDLLERFDELVDARLGAVEFHQLALAGYPVDRSSAEETSDPASLNAIIEFLDRQLLQTSTELKRFEERSHHLIAAAAENLKGGGNPNPKLDQWFHHLAVIEQLYAAVPQLRELSCRLDVLVRRRPESDLSGQSGERFSIHMQTCELLKRIEDFLGSLPCPFDDFGARATMWDYLTADVGTRHEATAQSAAMARAVVERIAEFYLRVMGQLATELDREGEFEEASTLFDRWAKLGSL